MPRPWPHTAAILAGGCSRRMGQAKHLMRLPHGRTLLETVVDALRPHVGRIVVVTGPGASDPAVDLQTLLDLREDCGPLGGIEAVLASDLDEQYLICPCDIPLINAQTIASLTKNASAKATFLRVEGEERPRPLPARISCAALDDVRALLDSGQRAVHALMELLEPELVQLPSAAAESLLNVNDAQEYERVCARWRERGG